MKAGAEVPLTPSQKTQLLEFRRSLNLSGHNLPLEDDDKPLITLLRRSQWDVSTANRAFVAYQREHRHAKRLVSTQKEEMKEIVVRNRQMKGFVYVHGRTVDMGCVVIVNFAKADLGSYRPDDYIDSILFILESILLVNPYDRWVVILDLTAVPASTLPAKVPATQDIKRAIDTLQLHYPDHLERMFLMGFPVGLRTMWGLIEQFIDENVRLKLEFSAEKESKRLLHYIEAEKLERKFGGKAPTQSEFWPVVIPSYPNLLKTTASGPIFELNTERKFVPTYSMASSTENISRLEFDPYQIQDIQLPPVDCVTPDSQCDPTSKLRLKFESITSGEENRASLMNELEIESRESRPICSCHDGFLEYCSLF